MPNEIDTEIGQMIEAYTVECEKAHVSRNMDEQGRRTKEIVANHKRLDVLGSAYWEGLYYEAKIMVLREAVLELAAKAEKPAKAAAPAPEATISVKETVAAQVDLEEAVEDAKPVKKPRAKKVALA